MVYHHSTISSHSSSTIHTTHASVQSITMETKRQRVIGSPETPVFWNLIGRAAIFVIHSLVGYNFRSYVNAHNSDYIFRIALGQAWDIKCTRCTYMTANPYNHICYVAVVVYFTTLQLTTWSIGKWRMHFWERKAVVYNIIRENITFVYLSFILWIPRTHYEYQITQFLLKKKKKTILEYNPLFWAPV